MSVLGLCCYAAFSLVASGGFSLVAVPGVLVVRGVLWLQNVGSRVRGLW